MALCELCQQISFASLYGSRFRHHNSLEALESSKSAGCPLCDIFFESLSNEILRISNHDPGDPRLSELDSEIWIESWPSEMDRLFGTKEKLQLRIGLSSLSLNSNIAIAASYEDPSAEVIRSRLVYPSSSSDELFARVAKCLAKCQSEHPECRPSLSMLPTRVLDTGFPDQVRLLVTNGIPGDYVALSYRWGDYPALKTTTANLTAHCQEIHFDKIPRTIQDAITVTRRLGYRYLWVDALCIIQDSLDSIDWVEESAKMAAVYGNASVTLAAELATHCGEGIFRNRGRAHSVQLPFYLQDGSRCGSVHLFNPSVLASSASPLSTRGWTFQEKELSKRILHYGVNSITFQCKGAVADESDGFNMGGTPFGSLLSWVDDRHSNEMNMEQSLDKWYGYVSKYTARDLTVDNDKLPALSGMAHEMSQIIPGRYIAGMWACDLAYGLTWRSHAAKRGSFTGASVKRKGWRGPSWSWVSVDGPVGYEIPVVKPSQVKEGGEAIATIRQAQIDILTKDPMGQVGPGTLVVEGRLRQAKWEAMESWEGKLQQSHLVWKFDVLLDAFDAAAPFACCLFDDHSDRPDSVWCLLLCAGRGVMLVRTASGAQTYRRVGYFELDGDAQGWGDASGCIEIT